MNYYIDFDNTLYETAKLTSLMLEAISKTISEEKKLDFKEILEEAKSNFNSTVDNIFSFGEKMAQKYDANKQEIILNINSVIDNGKNIVFEDAKRFLDRIRENGDKAIILTYIAKGNQEYQLKKIIGSGLANKVDEIFITSELKYTLDLDYKNGIFIDDDPRDLNGLFEQNPIKVIRIRKPNNKRSKIDIDNKEIEEYESFDDFKLLK
jgi:FMN phosphatase YigB (HAD superfamily)